MCGAFMKIAVYGIGNVCKHLCEIIEKRKEVEVVYFIQTAKTQNTFLGKRIISIDEIGWKDFDILVIATTKYYKEIVELLEKKYSQKDINGKIVKASDYLFNAKIITKPYDSVKTEEGLVFIADSRDKTILEYMLATGKTWSYSMIDRFFELSEKYYSKKRKMQKGIFLDIGANIGTTSIYVNKIINNKLKIIGFEPVKINYNLFRANCILNSIDNICIEPFGLSNASNRLSIAYSMENPGGATIDKEQNGVKNKPETEEIAVITLDSYVEQKNISSEEIDYIWLDVEGHEVEVLEGAFNTLSGGHIPLIQEFNAVYYIETDRLKKYCNIIKNFYNSFIDLHSLNGEIQSINIEEIENYAWNLKRKGKSATDLFFF